MSDNDKKHAGGRPNKFDTWVNKATEIISNNSKIALYLTDEELIDYVNFKIPESEQIACRTYCAWKAGEYPDTCDNISIKKFLRLVKNAKAEQKIAISEEIRSGNPGWQGSAWIGQRKFVDYKDEKNIDVTTKGQTINREDLSRWSDEDLKLRLELEQKYKDDK